MRRLQLGTMRELKIALRDDREPPPAPPKSRPPASVRPRREK